MGITCSLCLPGPAKQGEQHRKLIRQHREFLQRVRGCNHHPNGFKLSETDTVGSFKSDAPENPAG